MSSVVTPESGHCSMQSAYLKRAKSGEPEKMANQLFRVQRSKLANRSASLAAKRQQIFLAITEDWPVSRAFGD